MSILKLLLAIVVVVAVVLFAIANNHSVTVDLWRVHVDIWLPLLVAGAFLLGLVPTWLWMAASRMRVRRRLRRTEGLLDQRESELAEARVELLRPAAGSHDAAPDPVAAPDIAAGPATDNPAADAGSEG